MTTFLVPCLFVPTSTFLRRAPQRPGGATPLFLLGLYCLLGLCLLGLRLLGLCLLGLCLPRKLLTGLYISKRILIGLFVVKLAILPAQESIERCSTGISSRCNCSFSQRSFHLSKQRPVEIGIVKGSVP